MAATRLRKTFKYPSDDEHSDASRDELDEEEQENLVSSLENRSLISNAVYTIVMTLLPLALTPIFVYHLILSSTTPARLRLLCLLSVTSLLATSFSMFFMSSIDGTDARARLDRRQQQMSRRTFAAQPGGTENVLARTLTRVIEKLDDVKLDLDADGPLLQALPWLNGAMCGLLTLAAWIVYGQALTDTPAYMWLYFIIPSIMFGMVQVGRRALMQEEKGLRELRGLRYGYKGA